MKAKEKHSKDDISLHTCTRARNRVIVFVLAGLSANAIIRPLLKAYVKTWDVTDIILHMPGKLFIEWLNEPEVLIHSRLYRRSTLHCNTAPLARYVYPEMAEKKKSFGKTLSVCYPEISPVLKIFEQSVAFSWCVFTLLHRVERGAAACIM